MGVQTRSSASSSPVKPKSSVKVVLPTADGEPYKVFVLPKATSKDARFLFLKNPRDGERRRFFFCPQTGLYEVTRVNTTTLDPRSLLFAPDFAVDSSNWSTEGYVNKSAEIFVLTPFDPVFLLLPLLAPPLSESRGESVQSLYRPLDDLLDEQSDDDRHLQHVLAEPLFRPKLLRAMDRICDSLDAGSEQMYRLNSVKLYDYLLEKARRVVQKGLPASLEERFVTRAVEVPMLSVKRDESSISFTAESSAPAPECPNPDESDSQFSTVSATTPIATSGASSSTTTGVDVVEQQPSVDLLHLQRLRTALSFIEASYLSPQVASELTAAAVSGKAAPDFAPLDEHLLYVAKIRAEALASRSISDFSKKRNLEDDEAGVERAEKKRRQEEEDKKKKSQESRGVRDLKKVNVTGMKKMSDFFAKKGPAIEPKS